MFKKKKTFLEQAADFAESARESFDQAYHSARDNAGPALTDLKDKVVEGARETATERVAPAAVDAKDRTMETVAPLLAAAAEVAREKAREASDRVAEKASETAAASKEVAAARVAQIKGEPAPSRSGGVLKRLLVLTGLAALGAVVFKTMRDRKAAEDNWQSAYVPAPATKPPSSASSTTAGAAAAAGAGVAGATAGTGTGAAAETDDIGGAGPDEALSDAAEVPHPASTPDAPAEEIDVEGGLDK